MIQLNTSSESNVLVFFPEMFESFDGIKSVTDLVLELKLDLKISDFLIPDSVYDFLKSMLESVDYDFDEYSTRKWLTGFVPDVDKSLLSKIHIILNRKDISPISNRYPDVKKEDPFEQVVEFIKTHGRRGTLFVCKAESVEKLKEKGFVFGIKPIKGFKNTFLLQINT